MRRRRKSGCAKASVPVHVASNASIAAVISERKAGEAATPRSVGSIKERSLAGSSDDAAENKGAAARGAVVGFIKGPLQARTANVNGIATDADMSDRRKATRPASVGLVDGLQRDGLAGVLALMLFSARGLASASPGQVDTWLSHALAPALAAFFL